MPNPVTPPPGTQLRRFLDAMLDGLMHTRPEFLQRVGHYKLAAMADDLRALGWPVRMAERHAPTNDEPHRRIAVYFIGDHSLAALTEAC